MQVPFKRVARMNQLRTQAPFPSFHLIIGREIIPLKMNSCFTIFNETFSFFNTLDIVLLKGQLFKV